MGEESKRIVAETHHQRLKVKTFQEGQMVETQLEGPMEEAQCCRLKSHDDIEESRR